MAVDSPELPLVARYARLLSQSASKRLASLTTVASICEEINMNKTALVTGGSAGIGKETVRALVAKGYEVMIAARDAAKGRALIQSIKSEYPLANVAFTAVDMSDFSQVAALGQRLRKQWVTLDALVLNAGSFTPALRTNADGYEFMFASTHLGHFLLTHYLLDRVVASPSGRIVVTSSVAHFFGGSLDFQSLTHPSRSTFLLLQPFLAYGRSKLSNLLFVRELARKLADTNVKVNAFHPGSVKTDIWRDTPSLFNAIISPTLISEAEGAQTQIYLATDPQLRATGQHWFKKRVERGSPASRDPKLARELWAYSERALGIIAFARPDSDAVDTPSARLA